MDKYRVSSYTIDIKLKNFDNKYMLIHGYTGAIDVAPENVISFIHSSKDYFIKDSVPFSIATFDSLLKRGYITTKSKEEECSYVKRMANALHKIQNNKSGGFTFVVSYNCNFRCPYCYESQISGNGSRWTKKTFTKEMVDRAYETIEEITLNKNKSNKMINLYGGEPLLAENKEIAKYIIDKGSKLGYKFSAVTNGYDLDKFEDILDPEIIYSMQITMDGYREHHDKRRVHFQTRKSFDKILDNIEMALKKGIQITVRVNTDSDNFDDLPKLKQLFHEKGFNDYHFSFYSAMTMHYSKEGKIINEHSNNPNIMTRKIFLKKHEESGYNIACQDNLSYRKIYTALKNSQKLSLSPVFCGLQTNSACFDPYGKIYSCWETVGEEKYIIGEYDEHLKWNQLREKWKNRDIGTIKGCNTCKYAFLCSGGCPIRAVKSGKGIYSSVCDEFPTMLEMGVNKAYDQYIKEKSKTQEENKQKIASAL